MTSSFACLYFFSRQPGLLDIALLSQLGRVSDGQIPLYFSVQLRMIDIIGPGVVVLLVLNGNVIKTRRG